ncbi:hypothetical protein [Cellvibrio sp. KY-YJ-3]|uniref:hypothetical protein n=1 Tax=Cellvibrio sp. KY-YJ-3 TaxID=454662 RepID=UPI00124484C6|nr:hypothetical protein [Cellvibrio sp. KY-YJ-3]QEY12879.1 hypothetical protein D0B88_11820 [Cellvibrio sp. KY-YJ-3]
MLQLECSSFLTPSCDQRSFAARSDDKIGRNEVVMGICASDLQQWIIKPCLEALGDYSPFAEQLLLATAAQESQLGLHCYSEQYQGLGLYRITRNKHRELWDLYLIQFPDLASRQRGLASQQQFLLDPERELVTNLSYSTGMAWMIYRRAHIDCNNFPDLPTLAQLWAAHFDNGTGAVRNTDGFIQSYNKLITPYLHRQVA